MVSTKLYQQIAEAHKKREKQFWVLIDPDNVSPASLQKTMKLIEEAEVDLLLVGGSLLANDTLDECLEVIKQNTGRPVIIFPGSTYQINPRADGILFLSLISGRNPELLIGQHVLAAPYLRNSPLEVISTGYILIDGGVPTTVSYMSNTTPIPSDKDEIAVCTALAGEMLGLKMLYLDAGSGAETPVSTSMIRAVKRVVSVPLLVGGGLRTPERALGSLEAGADIIVVGNAVEKDPGLIMEMAGMVHGYQENIFND